MSMARRYRLAWILAAALAWSAPSLAQGDKHGGEDGSAESHAEPAHAESEHGAHGAGEINWFYGFFGEKEGAEPSLLWRPKGMPPPFGAMLINTAILFYLLGRYAGPKIGQALSRRKATIMHGMDEAAKMKEEAQRRLSDYEQKLASVDEEVERVRKDMRETGELERARILSEAAERRARMERDAKLLIELELKAAREELLRQTVTTAVRSAEDRLTKQVTVADQQRIAEHYLKSISTTFGGKG
jgi:F-type H+-transporting ATPase subunit b